MNSPQTQQEESTFNNERADITSELHTIVDNLQPDAPMKDAPTRTPFWQRTGLWQVPLCLIALAVILMYNPRVDNCNGFKVTYKRQVLCISNDADFFLFVENFTCDAIENGPSVMDSLVADEAAMSKMKAYSETHDFSIETQPIEAEVLRGMRGQYDSTSFCKNFTKACWNAGIRLLNEGQKDSACYYFRKIDAWSWGDSVLTAADKSVISQNCYGDFLQTASTENPIIYPNADFVEGECCMINYNNIAFRSQPLSTENMRAVNNRTQTQKETPKSIDIDNRTLIGTLMSGDKAFFLGKAGAFFKIRLQASNQIGYIATSYNSISTLIKGCNTSTPAPKGLNAVNNRLKNSNNVLQNRINQQENKNKVLDTASKTGANAPNKQNLVAIDPPTIPNKVTGLPITLYFDNDSPDPRSRETTTNLNYSDLYTQYYNKKAEYQKMNADESEQIASFFDSHIRFGYQNLAIFSDSLIAQLNSGQSIEIVLGGYTVSTNNAAYNKTLSSRQINAVTNHFYRYQSGILGKFISIGQLRLRVIPYGSDSYSQPKSIYNIEAIKARKVVIQEIERLKYDRK